MRRAAEYHNVMSEIEKEYPTQKDFMEKRNRTTKAERLEMKAQALEIYEKYKGDINFSRNHVVGLIQKKIKKPRYFVSNLILEMGLYPKREKKIRIEAKDPNNLVCPICQAEKPKSEFPIKGKLRNGETRYSYCKECHSSYQRNIRLTSVFGLNREQYDLLGNFCRICGRTGKTKEVSVDHDHKTGLIRGRLCDRCNRGIAWFQDNPELLRDCANYLENPPAEKVLGIKVYGRKGRVNKKRK